MDQCDLEEVGESGRSAPVIGLGQANGIAVTRPRSGRVDHLVTVEVVQPAPGGRRESSSLPQLLGSVVAQLRVVAQARERLRGLAGPQPLESEQEEQPGLAVLLAVRLGDELVDRLVVVTVPAMATARPCWRSNESVVER